MSQRKIRKSAIAMMMVAGGLAGAVSALATAVPAAAQAIGGYKCGTGMTKRSSANPCGGYRAGVGGPKGGAVIEPCVGRKTNNNQHLTTTGPIGHPKR